MEMQSLPPQQPVEAFPGHAAQSCCQPDLLILLLSSCRLTHCHCLSLLSTLDPCHIVKVCQGPHAQNVQNVNAMTTPRLAPEDLQFLLESIRVMVTLSAPTMPPPESEGEKTPGDEGF